MKSLPLLPAPDEKIAKDASRAVRRADKLVKQPVTGDVLNALTGLPGMRITHVALEEAQGERYVHLFCEHEHTVAMCPRCMQIATGIHEQEMRSVRHLDSMGYKTVVHFPQRRFDCEECHRPFTETLTWIAPKRRQTNAFEAHIYAQVKAKMPRRQVARQAGLHEATVLDIFRRQAQRAIRQEGEPVGVRVLGVDEISLRKGHQQYALVLSDLEKHRVVAVLPDRRKETFVQWLASLTEAERHAIKIVSMDMREAYRQAVRETLGHARIVADRFHMMQQLQHQVNLTRRRLQRKAKREGSETLYRTLKGSRWTLLKNREALTTEQEAQLQEILAVSEELRQIYLLKEEFRLICDKIATRERAQRFLQAWVGKAEATGSRFLQRFLNTLRRWWNEFLNYFETGITQGVVEGINRSIRGIIRRAFGYRNFGNFRLQVLVECGAT